MSAIRLTTPGCHPHYGHMTDTHTAKIDPSEATAGDEFYLAGAWHTAKSVQHLTGGRIVVRWHSGGSMAGVAKNLAGRVRRVTA